MAPYHLAIDFDQWEKCKTHQCEHHAPRNFPWGHILQPQIYEAGHDSTAELRKLRATVDALRRENDVIRHDLEEYHRIFEVEERPGAAAEVDVNMQDVEEALSSEEDEDDGGEGSESQEVSVTASGDEAEEEDDGVTEDEPDEESDGEETEDDEPVEDAKMSQELAREAQGPDAQSMEVAVDKVNNEPEVAAEVAAEADDQAQKHDTPEVMQQDHELADEVYESAAETAMEQDRSWEVPPMAIDHKITDMIDPVLASAEPTTDVVATVPHGLPIVPTPAPPAAPAVNRVFVVIFRTTSEEADDLCELRGVFTNIVSANEAAHTVLRSLIPYLEDDEIYDKAPSELIWPNASHLGMPERRYNPDGEIRLSVDHKDLGMTFISVVRQDLDVMPVESSQVVPAAVEENQIPTRPEHPWDWPTDWQSTGVSTFGYEG